MTTTPVRNRLPTEPIWQRYPLGRGRIGDGEIPQAIGRLPTRLICAPAFYWHSRNDFGDAMQPPSIDSGTPENPSAPSAAEEPQRRDRARSGMLGEPAGVPPGEAR